MTSQNRHMLDFSSLVKAAQSLSDVLAMMAQRPGDLIARDGYIQRFEDTYDLCVKSRRRQLEDMSDIPADIDALGFKDMLRAAAERSLISDAQAWFAFRELRHTSAHVYDPRKAEFIFEALPAIALKAQALSARLSGLQKPSYE
jgi:nucleotidyltransferase substrate binding protein (TIGR01987 family)